MSLVADRDAGGWGVLVGADPHEGDVNALVLTVDDELPEDGGPAAVPGRVADVGLVGGGGRGVHFELVGVGQVGDRRLQALDVGAVAALGHREAAGQGPLHRPGQEGLMVPLGAQVGDRAAEQAVLDSGLDDEAEIAHRQHLELGDRLRLGAVATLGRGEACDQEPAVDQGEQLLQCPRAGTFHRPGRVPDDVVGGDRVTPALLHVVVGAIEGAAERLPGGGRAGGRRRGGARG